MPRGRAPAICEHGLRVDECTPCRSARQKAYYAAYCERRGGKEVVNTGRAERGREQRKDPEFVTQERERGRKYWEDLRHEVIMAYGGYRCVCCGETEPLFLELDHINNDGAEHRRSLGYEGNGKGASSRTLNWLKQNGYPPMVQVLCANCNKGKARNGGVCPHCVKK